MKMHSVQFAILGLPLFGEKKSARIGEEFSTLNGSYDIFKQFYQKKSVEKHVFPPLFAFLLKLNVCA